MTKTQSATPTAEHRWYVAQFFGKEQIDAYGYFNSREAAQRALDNLEQRSGTSKNCTFEIHEVPSDKSDIKQHSFYAVMGNHDTTERRGPLFFTGVGFIRKEDAIAFVKSDLYAKRWGVMGTKGSEYNVQSMTFTLYHSIAQANEHFGKHLELEMRTNALNKLTAEERRLLGLE